jgi:hypothetical protein
MHLSPEAVDTVADYIAASQFDLIAIRNGRLANRVALHLALGGGFVPPTP